MTATTTNANHSWARNAAACAIARSEAAKSACGTMWRGSSIGYMSIRHPSEGAPEWAWELFLAEVETTLALQRLARMF